MIPGPHSLFDPGLAPVMVLAGLTTLLAMVGLALRDCRSFEIDFALLGVAALGLTAVMAGSGTAQEINAALVMAGIMGLITTALHVLCPGRIGQGDIWLVGFLGLAAGPGYILPVLVVFCLLSGVTAAFYTRIRGKPFTRVFRTMFPLALPGMGTAILALVLRLRETLSGERLTLGDTTHLGLVFCGLACATGLAWVLIWSGHTGRERTTP